MMNKRLFLAAALAIGAPAVATAQAYPARPITIVVGFAAGGSLNDIVARLLAPRLADLLKVGVVVDNKVGAGGMIATNALLNSAQDGYMLMMASGSQLVANVALQAPHDAARIERGLVPISLIARTPLVLVGNRKSLAATSLAGLVAYARKHPAALNYGTAGMGSNNHVATEYLRRQLGIEMTAVHYKGAAPAGLATVNGEVQLTLDTPTTMAPFIKGGQLRAYAVAGASRTKLLPDVPSFGELGIPFDASTWMALVAPGNMPQDRVELVGRALREVLKSGEFQAKLEGLGLQAFTDASAAAAAAFLAKERETWMPIGRAVAASR